MKNKLREPDVHQIADQLFKIREEIAAYRDGLKPMEEKEESLREAMLRQLTKLRVDNFRSEGVPMTFTRAFRKGYEIKDEPKARIWAVANDCIKIDTTAMSKHLEGSGALPEGIEYKETPYLAIRKAN